MPLAALYDIHGNLPALEAVMEDVRASGVEHVIVGGDVIPGPMPREALDYLFRLDLPVSFLQGNGETEVLARLRGQETGNVPAGVREVIAWVGEQLEPTQIQAIADWPLTAQHTVADFGDVLFCHATPRNNTEIFTQETPDANLLPVFDGVKTPLVVCGHTHVQFDRRVGDIRIVNAGSVGMPFAAPAAYWLLLDRDVELRKTDYDLGRAAERIRATAYPQAEEFARRNILDPPREEEILRVYAKAQISG